MTMLKRVVVDGRYTYVTGKKVKVGDRVILPTPDWLRDVRGETFEGTITALKSGYDGPCKRIIGIVRPKNPKKAKQQT
jgi:hypothetical protein